MMMKGRGGVRRGCICNATAATALWDHQVSPRVPSVHSTLVHKVQSGVPAIKLPFEYHLYTQLWYYQVPYESIRCPLDYHQYTQLSVTKYSRHSLYVVSLYVPLSTIGTLNFESQRTVVIHYMLCLYVSQEYHWYTQL